VEVAVGDDDGRGIRGDALRAVRPRAGDLDPRLDGLRTGVHRQHEVLAAQLRERRGEGAELIVVERSARQRDPAQLRGGRGHQGGVAVTEVEGGVGGQQIEVALALDVGHPGPLTAGDDDRQRVIVVRDVLVLGRDEGGGGFVDGDGGAHFIPRSSSVQHLMPPPPSSSSDRSTGTGT